MTIILLFTQQSITTFNKPSNANSNLQSNTAKTTTSAGASTTIKTSSVNVPEKEKTQSKQGDFSESLQKYIQLSFDKCKSAEDRANCQKALTKIISASLKKGDFTTRDWMKFPLPVLPTEFKEEIQAITLDEEKAQ